MRASLPYLAAASLGVMSAACGEKGDLRPSHGDALGTAGSTTSAGGASGVEHGGRGGAADVEGELVYGFDEDDGGWAVQYTSSAAAEDLIDKNDVELDWSEDSGDPGGALRVVIPYDAAGQYVGFGISLAEDEALDLSGKTVTADVKIVRGIGTAEELQSTPAGSKIYAKSGTSFVFASGNFTNVGVIGEWVTIRFVIDEPGYVDEELGAFDPAAIRELGVQFDTSGTATSPVEGEIVIDNVRY